MKLTLASLVLFSTTALSQSLPPPSRTVYRCEEGGKVIYADNPCLGARKLEVEPTRGLNQASGREQIGKDVRNERFREGIAEAVKPLTGMDAKQLDQFGRRQRLTPEARLQCQRLDRLLPTAEAAETAASAGTARDRAQKHLLALRTAYRQHHCE